MRKNSFDEKSSLSSEDESIKMLYFPQKNVKYTFNDIGLNNLPFLNHRLLFLNILGIIILYFSYYYGYFSVAFIKRENYIINPIFIFVSLFLFITLIKNILAIYDDENNKQIIINEFSGKYTISFYTLSLFFLAYFLIPNGNNLKYIYLISFSIISSFLLSLSYYNFKKKEININYKNIFDILSLSFSLSLYTSFNFIILINTLMILFNNLFFDYLCLLISIVVITYYDDFIFSGLLLVYQMSFVKKFNFNDPYFICFILNGFCFIFSVLFKIKNDEKFSMIPSISGDEINPKEKKYFDDDSIIEIYNKQNNYYDSI